MRFLLSTMIACLLPVLANSADPAVKILFLGDAGHHKPVERFRQLQPAFDKRGIELVYTDKLDVLDAKTLAPYDGLMIYANQTKITPEQEQALLDYVAGGKGLIPLHCASYCFLNSPKYIDLVGAQFQKHGTGTFRTTLAEVKHPIIDGYKPFESWDETYQHTKHNENGRIVLEYRDKEPWTWVRTHGKGRIFYTAWGHDERTWSNPGFQALVERGTRWAIGKDPSVVPVPPVVGVVEPAMTPMRKDVKPFEYVDANIPFYAPKDGKSEKPRQMQKPLDAAESMKHFVTPVGFEVKAFVTEEKLGGKPIAMTWDERGRLWVSITLDYPNEMRPEGEGRDRIVVCEDTDGDGACDKVTTFADKLSIPTSLLNAYGGIIVHQAPHTLFLKDTDGDGKADVRQILFTGWGTRDTHAGPSNLRYGLDNWIYGVVGYSGFDGEVAGEKLSFRQGLYRFKLEREPKDEHKLKVTKLEFLRSTSNNSWGIGISEEGHLFGSTANGCASVHMAIPNRYYEKVRGLNPGVLSNIAADNHVEPITDKVRQVDWHHGFTAAAGHEIYTARTYPKEYWNKVAFICEPTAHLVAAMVITPDGSTFKTKYGWNLLASDDEWSAPIDAQVGPDGNVWVIDWYNYIVQHNPTPPGFKNGKGNAYETELRDKKHGRIYRVVYTGERGKVSPPSKPFTLKDAKPEGLVASLKNDNMKWRLHAQRLLVEGGIAGTLTELGDLLRSHEVDANGFNGEVLHALHLLEFQRQADEKTRGRQPPSGGLIANSRASLLTHPSKGVRLTAIRMSACWPFNENREPYYYLAVQDPDPNVRLAVLLSIAQQGMDYESKRSESNTHYEGLVNDILRKDEGKQEPIWYEAFAMACASHPTSMVLLLSRSQASGQALQAIQRAAASLARSRKMDWLVRERTFQAFITPNSPIQSAMLRGAAEGWPADYRPKFTIEDADALTQLFPQIPVESQRPLTKLARIWGIKGIEGRFAPIITSLMEIVADEKATDKRRIEAAKQVIEFRPEDDEVISSFVATLSVRSSPEFASGILDALSASESPKVGPAVITRLNDLSPAGRAMAVRLLLARTRSTGEVLSIMEDGSLSIGDLSLDQRQSLASHPDKSIAQRAKALLAKGGGLPDADRQKIITELLEVTKKKGDAELGKAVFKAQCAKCHVHGSEGTRIGPDLTGVAVHTKEHLLTDILDPSRGVEGNFRVWRVTTLDGKTLSGLLAAETRTSIELIDPEAKRITLQRDDIETLTASTKSLMPEGFEKQFKENDLVNLLEFLTLKGKYLPLPLDKTATVVSTKGMFYSESVAAERLIFPDWSPKTFEGVPFQLVDPQGDKVRNVIMLHSRNGSIPPTMPKSVTVPCNTPAAKVHLLSGVSGWGSSGEAKGTVSMIVRLHYADGKKEDHELKDGVHFADYIRRVDVSASKFAYALRGQQVRYLAITPRRDELIKEIEFVKGPDATAPIVMAVTVEPK